MRVEMYSKFIVWKIKLVKIKLKKMINDESTVTKRIEGHAKVSGPKRFVQQESRDASVESV